MERITVNLEDGVAGVLTTKAKSQNHSASGYVELLIKADLRAAGLLPDSQETAHAEVLAKLNSTVQELEQQDQKKKTNNAAQFVAELEMLVRKATRRTRRPLSLASAK